MTKAPFEPTRSADLLRIGPLVALVAVAGRDQELLRDHYEGLTLSEPEGGVVPTLRLRLGDRAPIGREAERLVTAGDEIQLAIEAGEPLQVTGALRWAPRAVLRAVKRAQQPDFFRYGRRRLLLRHALEHPLMALLDLWHGHFTVHASAVARDGRALLILGANGTGKTTTAHRLVQNHACTWVTDNFAPTDGRCVLAFPGEPRLVPALEVPPRQPAVRRTRSARIAAVVLLCPGAPTRELAAAEARTALRDYVATEREDHRDTPLFTRLRALTGASTADIAVAERLAELPTILHGPRGSFDLSRLLTP